MGSQEDEELDGLDGVERHEVATGLWQAWRSSPRSVAVLTGASGIGKSNGVVAPLLQRADDLGLRALLVEVPAPRPGEPFGAVDVEVDLLDRLRTEMEDAGISLSEEQYRRRGFFLVLRTLIKDGVLVVVDEFQRLLDARGRPVPPFDRELSELGARRSKGGLWLVSNRTIDPAWTEPFHVATLPKPAADEASRIVMSAIPAGYDPEEWFPADRRAGIVERLGANPRVLRLLGSLLGRHSVDDLLGDGPDPSAEPDDPSLVEAIERDLIVKATEGLPGDDARKAVADLSVLEDWAEPDLREAMIGRLGDVRELTRTLLSRYLLEAHPARAGSTSARTLYRVHPVVRELDVARRHGNEAEWRAAHRRAGEWYARPLLAKDLAQVAEHRLAAALDRTRYHLRKAEADDLAGEVLGRVFQYLEKYRWENRIPELAAERDGRIALLSAYLADTDEPGLDNHLAWLLRSRNREGDAALALRHAERSTVGQVASHPWVLWIKLVRQVKGPLAAVPAGRKAARHVREYLYRVYTATAAALAAAGRPAEAVAELRKGCQAVPRVDRFRLAQHALFYAAGETDPALLEEVRDWLKGLRGLEPQATLGDILVLQARGRWRESAELAHEAASRPPRLVHYSVCEAIAWLAEKQPAKAREALRDAPDNSVRRMEREGKDWLAALVELSDHRPRPAAEKLARYLGETKVPTASDEIRALLLRLWDTRIATEGEFNPSFHIPVLPPSITGLPGSVHRPQYGGPVLPQHRAGGAAVSDHGGRPLTILAVATEWSSARGGLSTFNRRLCTALAEAGARVFCTAPEATEEERRQAAEVGVTLVKPAREGSTSVREAIARRPELPPGVVPDIVIGHGRITGHAADALLDHFPSARRLHFIHMASDEIEWFKPDRDDVGVIADERHREELDLGKGAYRVVAVGPRLFDRYVRDFSSDEAVVVLRLDPGFDGDAPIARRVPPGAPWSILLFGRAEDAELKGLDIAARAVALAVRERGSNAADLELKVRGAPEKSSARLREEMVGWAGDPVRPLIRKYSTDSAELAGDLLTASLVLMPSRAEGFGLTGVEAITAGTPVLVSAESGLGRFLRDVVDKEVASRFVVPVTGSLEEDAVVWKNAIVATLRNRQAAFDDVARLREHLTRDHTWAKAAAALLEECQPPRP
ncbi:MAG: glycosyltransferase [Saccharothrix sp.]|nr:glycosyltransferase [Saccharothrix sp.]